MLDLFKKDLGYKIVSILLALLLWFYVTNLQNPIIESTIRVPISYNGLKEGLITSDRPPSADVKVRGLNSIVTPLDSKDFTAQVDLSQAKLGDSSFIVRVVTPSGVDLISYNPKNINLSIDAITEKTFSIKVVTTGAVAQGYSSYSPSIHPSHVVIKGAQQLLSTLDTAQVSVDLNQAKENLNLNLPVSVIDKEGNPVPGDLLEISPKTVQVSVPVIPNVPTRIVPIKATIIGKPKENWRVSRVILEPETIKISGAYNKLEKVNQVVTQPIDITGLSENLSKQVALTPPEGISLLYDPVVNVIIQLEEAPVTKNLTGIPVTVENKPSGKTISIKPEKIDITIQGSRQEMEKFDKNDIKALVDSKNLEIGVHQLEVKIVLPNNLQIIKVEPSKIEVTIDSID